MTTMWMDWKQMLAMFQTLWRQPLCKQMLAMLNQTLCRQPLCYDGQQESGASQIDLDALWLLLPHEEGALESGESRIDLFPIDGVSFCTNIVIQVSFLLNVQYRYPGLIPVECKLFMFCDCALKTPKSGGMCWIQFNCFFVVFKTLR